MSTWLGGYVDQPPFCVVVLKAWRVAFGDSLASIRMLPAMVGAATVLITGLLVVELGGEALAVVLGSLAVLVAGQFLGTAHYYSMNVFDQLFWVLAAYLAVRALREGTPRMWILHPGRRFQCERIFVEDAVGQPCTRGACSPVGAKISCSLRMTRRGRSHVYGWSKDRWFLTCQPLGND